MPSDISGRTLMWPTVLALRELGGSGRPAEIDAKVLELGSFTEAQQSEMIPSGRSTRLSYNMSWARTYLKRIRLAENSDRAVWTLTELGRTISESQCQELVRERKRSRTPDPDGSNTRSDVLSIDPDSEMEPDEGNWKALVLDKLKAMPPNAFERLAQRLLREAGFRNVEVLGKSGDGGIDGVGVYRLSLVSFPIYFQCKRYQGSVSASAVRDFRGAMAGRGEKGLLITTGYFTQSAQAEAARDGAAPVELVSGDALCDLLKDYEIGIKVTKRIVEDIEVEPKYFDQFEK